MSYHLDAVTFFLYTLKHQQCCSDLHCFVLATELGSAACLLGRMLVWCGIRSWKPLVWCVHELSHVPYGQDFGCIHNMAKKCMGPELVMEASQVFTIEMEVLRLAKSKQACTG